MLKRDVQIGSVYDAKVSGQRVEVRIDRESPHGIGWEATNLSTGRTVRIKTAARLSAPSRRDRRYAANGDTVADVKSVGGDINDPNEGPAALRKMFRFS